MQPEQSPFDFILNSGEPSQRSSLPLGSQDSPIKRGLLVGAVALVLIVIGIIFMAILNGGGDTTTLLKVAQAQQETVRVADTIRTEATSQAVRNVGINTYLGVSSDKTKFIATTKAAGIKFSDKELLLGQNSKTDAALEAANTAGTYDVIALEALKQNVSQYLTAISTAYDQVSNAAVKDTLKQTYANTMLLNKQLEATRP